MKNLPTLLIIVFVIIGCASGNQESETNNYSFVSYAKGFKVSTISNAKLVEVVYPYQGATSGYKYLLVPKGAQVPAHEADTKVIYVPIESIVCTSTTHIPLLDYLDATDRLIGFPTKIGRAHV